MAYRGDAGEVCEAPCAEGALRAELAARHVRITVADRSVDITDAFATLRDHPPARATRDRKMSLRIAGRLVVARGVPRDDLGVWVELEPGGRRAGFRRIFGVAAVNLLEPAGLTALAALDRLAARLREQLAHLAPDVRRAVELGPAAAGGLDKVLVLESADRTTVFVRPLFRDRARRVLAAYADGRITVGAGGPATLGPGDAVPSQRRAGHREINVRSRHGVVVGGSHLWFTDPHGATLGKIAIPWIELDDRIELARRIGQRIDHESRTATVWPPHLPGTPGPR